MSQATITRTEWRIAGDSVGSCNCTGACPCQLGGLPTGDNCEAIAGWHIHTGHFGETSLDGVRFAEALHWPGPIHEGGGTRQLILDEASTPEQREAITQITAGNHGHPFFEIFASVCPNVPDPIVAPIELEVDVDARKAKLNVPGVATSAVEPVHNVATGDEHRAQVVLPNGFEFKQAEVANNVGWRVSSAAPLSLQHENTYSHLYAFDWSSDGTTR